MRMLCSSVVGRRTSAALFLQRGGVAGSKRTLAATDVRGTSCSFIPNSLRHRCCPSLVCCEDILGSAMASLSEGSVVLCFSPSHSCLPPSLPFPLATFPRSLHQREHPARGIQVHPRDGSIVRRHRIGSQCRQVGSRAHFSG